MNVSLVKGFGFIVDFLIIVFLLAGIVGGYKKGFLESTIRLIGNIITFLGAYLLKGPLSIYLYTNLPFFKLDGFFEGLSVLNVIIYELIAFVILWVLFSIILGILVKVFKLERLMMMIVTKLRIPNKFLGAVFGFLEMYLFVYFFVLIAIFFANFNSYDMNKRLASYVFKTPLLYETFAPTYNALEDIVEITLKYENSNDKVSLNTEALGILIEYDLIDEEDINTLIGDNKIEVSVEQTSK